MDLEHHYLIVEHYTRTVIPTPGYFLVLASRLTNESMAYRWAFTCTWPPSFSYLIASPGGLAMIHILRPLSRPVFADGGRLSGHSHRPRRSIYLLPRVPWSPTASLGPRNTFTLRASRLVRLLLGAPFPVPSLSCFSLLYEMVGTAAGAALQGSCHWFVFGESAGLSFSIFDSPLVGSVPSCCWCFTLRCLFSLALRYWLTLLLHSPLFHIQITSKFSTSPHNRHYMPRLKVCFLTVLPVPIPANLTLTATPVDRSLVMRALGGVITSPCSNDPESRRPTPTIFGLSPQLLFNCWMLLDSPIQITALSGRLLIVFCVHSWLVQLPLYYRIICIEFFC